MDLLLKGLKWSQNSSLVQGDFRIRKNLIAETGSSLIPQKRERVLNFSNHYLYPGLINAHDHLEMNLYPKLGNPPYQNYTQWGLDIYKPTESPIKEIEKVDIEDRLLWGGAKNLISGVTTVVHHNPWKRILSSKKFPVKVLEKFAWSHSLASGKNLEKAFPKKPGIPFVIHAAEGIDDLAFDEIGKLQALGLLKKNTVLIHAIALRDADIERIKQTGAAVVWCPASNFFLFNQTASIEKLKQQIPVALGSDSTLTGSPTLLEEMKFAKGTGLASAEEIFRQVTSIPAKIFNVYESTLQSGSPADFFITPIIHENYFENLLSTKSSRIDLVVIDGELKLGDEAIAKELDLKKYFAKVDGAVKWLPLDIQKLKSRIRKITGNVVEANPLWQLVD